MTGLVFGSVCSGIEAASVAWGPLGWRCAFAAEIEAFPRAVLAHRHPATPLHGDFTTIQAGDYDPIDLLVGGTPCQSFSVAGLRGGLGDDRGNLALEYLRLADRLRPRWLVWENVPGVLSSNGGRDFGAILGGLVELGYGFAYRVLDAQFFGVAQRRRRVFVVGHLGDWRRAAAVLFERHSLSGHPAPRREAGEGFARPLAAGSARGSGYRNDADTANNLVAADGPDAGSGAEHPLHGLHGGVLDGRSDRRSGGAGMSGPRRGEAAGDDRGLECAVGGGTLAFGGNNTSGPIEVSPALTAHGGPMGRMDFDSEAFVAHVAPALSAANPYGDQEGREGHLVAHALRGEGFDASEDGAGRGTPIIACRVTPNSGAYETGDRIDALTTGTDRSAHVLVGDVYTLAERGRAEGRNLESRDDGTANAVLTPSGGRSGIGVGAVAFSITPSNSNKDSNARETERAQALSTGGGRPSARGGDFVVEPGADDAIGFDLAQITSQTNRSRAEAGLPASTLSKQSRMHVASSAVLRLTPRECERLQGFPDDYTLIPYRGREAADGPRYKALGNSMAVPVMAWIARRIAMVDAMPAATTEGAAA